MLSGLQETSKKIYRYAILWLRVEVPVYNKKLNHSFSTKEADSILFQSLLHLLKYKEGKSQYG